VVVRVGVRLLRGEALRDEANDVEGAAEVDVDDAIEVVQTVRAGLAEHLLGGANSGATDGAAQGAVRGDAGVNGTLNVGSNGNIGANESGQ
jgi:hypothetical protein